MASVFTKIIHGEIPCYKIAENEFCFAFLDINPIAKGHVLVVPKNEIDYIFDLDDVSLAELVLFSKKLAIAIEKSIKCQRIGMAVIGLEVPHAHIHLVPLNSIFDIDFSKPKLKFSPEELKEIANDIVAKLNQ